MLFGKGCKAKQSKNYKLLIISFTYACTAVKKGGVA